MSIIFVDPAAANVLPLAALCKRPFVPSCRRRESECRLLSRYRRRRMRDVEVVGAGGALEINSPAKSMERRARASLETIPPPSQKDKREDSMLESSLTKERVSIKSRR